MHASAGKNTAHRVAWELCKEGKLPSASGDGCASPDQLVLVNLDCDNVPGPLFIPTLVSEFNKARTMRPWPPCVWISNGGGKTGRTAHLACMFMNRLNGPGYGEDLEPVGYQDIDVVNRIAALQVGGPAKKHQKPQKGQVAIGRRRVDPQPPR